MTDILAAALSKKSVLVADGAMGTEIENLNIIENQELWSSDALIHHPEAVYKIHYDYLEAGADIITTATYQANPLFLEKVHAVLPEHKALITEAVEIAQKARTDFNQSEAQSKSILIAGSVGPYGAYLNDGSEYRGDYVLTKAQFKRFHLPQLKLLVQSGVDLLAFETMPNFIEIQALVELLKEDFPQTSAWVSFSVNQHFDLCDGTPLEKVTSYLTNNPQISAIGVNCTDIVNISPILDRLRPLVSKPIIVYPNNGDEYDVELHQWCPKPEKPSFFDLVPQWVAKGARLIGGCCRTTPADIHEIWEETEELKHSTSI